MSHNMNDINGNFSMGDVVRFSGFEYPGLYEVIGECDAAIHGEDVFEYDYYVTHDFAESEIKVRSEDLILVCGVKNREDINVP